MNNLFQLTVIVKKNDGTERKAFEVIEVNSYEGFLEAIWYLARVHGLRNYQKSKRSHYNHIRRLHRHYYENGLIRVQPLQIEIYN